MSKMSKTGTFYAGRIIMLPTNSRLKNVFNFLLYRDRELYTYTLRRGLTLELAVGAKKNCFFVNDKPPVPQFIDNCT